MNNSAEVDVIVEIKALFAKFREIVEEMRDDLSDVNRQLGDYAKTEHVGAQILRLEDKIERALKAMSDDIPKIVESAAHLSDERQEKKIDGRIDHNIATAIDALKDELKRAGEKDVRNELDRREALAAKLKEDKIAKIRGRLMIATNAVLFFSAIMALTFSMLGRSQPAPLKDLNKAVKSSQPLIR